MTLFELRADYIRRTMGATEKKEAVAMRLEADKYQYESQRNIDLMEYTRLNARISVYETIQEELSRLSF